MAKITRGRLRQAINENGGIIAGIARQFDVTRQTVYNWLDKYGLHDEIEAARADIFELAERNIFDAVADGDVDVSKFVLTHMPNKQKRRWSSKREVEVGAVTLSPETLRRLKALGVPIESVSAEFERIIQELHEVEADE